MHGIFNNFFRVIAALIIVMLMVTGCEKKSGDIVLRPIESAEESSASGGNSTDVTGSEEQRQDTGSSSADYQYSTDAKQSGNGDRNKGSYICVYVCGAVNSEGVYELPEGSRVFDAVDAAGGFRNDADISYCNQAAKLTDGIKLTIPDMNASGRLRSADSSSGGSIEILSSGITPQESAGDQNAMININLATKEQLCNIPGIGEGRANDIIKFRQEQGGFKTIEDIMQVTGIKEKLFEKIKDRITV